jgi:hypothetical protein
MSAADTISSRDEIQTASREQLVAYLENWGFQCYDSESTDELREAALQNWDTENG